MRSTLFIDLLRLPEVNEIILAPYQVRNELLGGVVHVKQYELVYQEPVTVCTSPYLSTGFFH